MMPKNNHRQLIWVLPRLLCVFGMGGPGGHLGPVAEIVGDVVRFEGGLRCASGKGLIDRKYDPVAPGNQI